MRVHVLPGEIAGSMIVPGDKSISHRALMLATLATGISQISGIADSADCAATRRIATALGATIGDSHAGVTTVESPGIDSLREPNTVLDAANSGTSTRLFAGILATQPFCAVMTGDQSLRARPMARVVEPLQKMGAMIDGRDNGRLLPLYIRGGHLHGITHTVQVASAQAKSAVLLAGLRALGSTTICEPVQSRDHTERMLSFMGVDVRITGTTVTVVGGATLRPFSMRVPGDLSSAAFFLAAGILTSGSSVSIAGVGVNLTRTGILDVLNAMGATVNVSHSDASGPEPIATLSVQQTLLHAVTIDGAIIPRVIDEIPLIALLATQATGRTIIRDAAELRLKESDRLATTTSELRRLGATITEEPAGLVIDGPTPLTGTVCTAHADHRIAMMLAVAGLIANGETTIENAECVEVSFPAFFTTLQAIGGRLTCEED